ncbi:MULTISPECIES: GspH/FimT family pseudopilin [unclassified Thiocapsa]|uniref:GspH/FimT family pseudopilin n=1 Tax=unclassified Thiocapsa TaxID=2641286 RepID=UPI0035B31BED
MRHAAITIAPPATRADRPVLRRKSRSLRPGVPHARSGFTLLELMITLAVLAILASIGVPTMQEMLERNRLKSAAQTLMEDLQWMRGEAIRRNRTLSLVIDANAWCYGITAETTCDCRLTDATSTDACVLDTAGTPVLKRTGGHDFRGVQVVSIASSLKSPPRLMFEPRRATATSFGSVTIDSPAGAQLRVILSKLGRVRTCSPNGSLPGFETC